MRGPTSSISVLSLHPAPRPRQHGEDVWDDVDGDSDEEAHLLDFVIDQRSLASRLGPALGLGMATLLNRHWLDIVEDSIDQFLGRLQDDDYPPGRIPLLVCHLCGDIGCGALTAALRMDEETVTWSDLQWENGYEDASPVTMRGEQSFTFPRAQYEAEFATVWERVSRLAPMPVDPRDRPTLWQRLSLWATHGGGPRDHRRL